MNLYTTIFFFASPAAQSIINLYHRDILTKRNLFIVKYLQSKDEKYYRASSAYDEIKLGNFNDDDWCTSVPAQQQ